MALSAKQQVFVEAYLASWNASEAARRAGYSHANVQGSRLLANVSISEEIQRRVAEMTLTANEVLVRLGEHARGSMGDFVRFSENGDPTFDLQAAALMGKMPLVKKLKTKTRTYSMPTVNVTRPEGDEEDAEEEGRVEIDSVEVTETSIEFELYDAQSALVQIGKHHGLFVERTEITGKDGEQLRIIIDYADTDPNATKTP